VDIGMLWFDNDKDADLDTKVERAAAYYAKKYGGRPNLCFVHPKMVKGAKCEVAGVEVRGSKSLLPNHLWLGVNSNS